MKFYGQVGYGESIEIRPGVWDQIITERSYYGDVLQFSRRWETGENLNDNLNIVNKINIVADPFAYENFYRIRYVIWMGEKWKVSNVEVQYPRLILTIGGVYNEEQIRIEPDPL